MKKNTTVLWLACNPPPHSHTLTFFLISVPLSLIPNTHLIPIYNPVSSGHCSFLLHNTSLWDLIHAPYLLVFSVLPLGHINPPQQAGLNNNHIIQGGLLNMEEVRNCMAPIIHSSLPTNKWIIVCNYFHFIQSRKKVQSRKSPLLPIG